MYKKLLLLPVDANFERKISTMTTQFTFPAIKGVQAKKQYYVAMISLYELAAMNTSTDEAVAPEERTQRVLSKKRIPQIASYIIENPDSYVFSALTMSIMGNVEFIPSSSSHDTGVLKIPIDTKFIVNDGQHRLFAIKKALKEQPSLKKEHISLVLFPNDSLPRAQQRFSDLNRYANRPNSSINILYDIRDEIGCISKIVAERVAAFNGTIEKEKITLSSRSKAMFTLSALNSANKALLDGICGNYQSKLQFAIDFWNTVENGMPDWTEVKLGTKKACDVRAASVNLLGITLYALGTAGNVIYSQHPSDWRDYILKLKYFDWHRDNPEWSIFLITEADGGGKKVVANRSARKNLAALITNKLLGSNGGSND